ncbi:MAG: hypothetical protein IPK07_00055 [Deltaproteobacteria bacterium]|nr:hypothetical protein [Deltaproteobacteria bacterium]
MRTFGALALLLALAYLIWRMQTRRAWIERIPLVLDVALAMGLAAAGIGALAQGTVRAAFALGSQGALQMGAALTAVHLVAWIVGKVPGCSGIQLDLELPVAGRVRLERARDGVDLVAYQGGNPSAWDRRQRSKRLWATVDAGDGTRPAIARLRVRYLPPAIGFDWRLRELIDAMLVEGAPPPERVRSTTGAWFPLEFLVIAGFLVFFAMVGFYRW